MVVVSENELWRERQHMVSMLLEKRGILDRRVLQAVQQVERHRFVDPELHARAYGPHALPIGYGHHMPHPQVVGTMLEALRLRGNERVLEIGTGSGYQTALLSLLGDQVMSLERNPDMAEQAEDRLTDFGYEDWKISTRADLNWRGISDFDAIHVNVAVPEVPGRLLEQLAPSARMVIPVGRAHYQRLLLLIRRGAEVVARDLGSCRLQPIENVEHPGDRQVGRQVDHQLDHHAERPLDHPWAVSGQEPVDTL